MYIRGSIAVKTSAMSESVAKPPLGLIAGEGLFPILVARGAKASGRQVICAGLSGSASDELRGICDHFKWVGILRLGQWIRFLRSFGCSEAIMVGRVKKAEMYSRFRWVKYIPDWRAIRLYFTDL